MNELKFTFAESSDEEEIRKLLSESGLPHEDIGEHICHFIRAKSNDDIIGVVGLEVKGKVGLLRSLAVASDSRGKGLAKALYIRVTAYARLQGIKELYLLTTTAVAFFKELSFSSVERDNIPGSIQATEEFRNLCPDNAVCMVKRIDKGAQYYPKEILRLQEDVPGAKMWGAALEKTMMTYFEVQPGSRFDMHSHESEQITMVLEGELFFEIEEGITCVRNGEVIAIPSNVPHTVFTQESYVKAVDAWSPVMEKYK